MTEIEMKVLWCWTFAGDSKRCYDLLWWFYALHISHVECKRVKTHSRCWELLGCRTIQLIPCWNFSDVLFQLVFFLFSIFFTIFLLLRNDFEINSASMIFMIISKHHKSNRSMNWYRATALCLYCTIFR